MLRRLTNRTAEVRTVDSKHLEMVAFDAANPACRVRGLAVGRRHVGISKRGEARLAFGEPADVAERNPGKVGTSASPRNRGKKKACDRNGKSGRDESIEENP